MCQVNDCLAIFIYGYVCPLLKIICLQLHEALFQIIAWLLLFFQCNLLLFQKKLCFSEKCYIYKAELLLLLSLTTYVVRAFYLCEFAGIMR